MTEVLARQDRALNPEETERLLRDRLDEGVTGTTVEFATFTVHVAPASWHAAVALCRDEPLLAYDMFDNLFGVDAREDGFDVVAVLYSTSTGNRICLRTRCDGGREAPVCDSITDLYRGADWMERETWDMFGIEFTGHPGLEPRLLTVENFEGWPLRKDFHLASRVAKPWPGVKEPAELDEDGQVIERVPQIGDAPGPYDLDKAMAEQAKAINAPAIDEGEQGEDDEPDQDASSDEADEEPELDQETYDRLIADGKSERIARSKAKAAFIKKQRAAQAEGSGGGDGSSERENSGDDGGADQAPDESEEQGAGDDGGADQASDESEEQGAGDDGGADQASDESEEQGAGDDGSDGEASGDDDPTGQAAADADGSDGESSEDDDPAAAAAAKADERRRAQAEARAKKAAERAADSGDTGDTDDAPAEQEDDA